MTNTIQPAGKAGKIIYWIATAWLALGMLSTGAVQLFKAKEGQGGVEMVTHLGYPVYLLTLLGILKLSGVIAVLILLWRTITIFFINRNHLSNKTTHEPKINDLHSGY